MFDWEPFTAILRSKYYPEHVKTKKRLELDALRMTDKMSVDEYYRTFTSILRLLPDLGYTGQVLVGRFYGGLSHRLRYDMGYTRFTSL